MINDFLGHNLVANKVNVISVFLPYERVMLIKCDFENK